MCEFILLFICDTVVVLIDIYICVQIYVHLIQLLLVTHMENTCVRIGNCRVEWTLADLMGFKIQSCKL